MCIMITERYNIALPCWRFQTRNQCGRLKNRRVCAKVMSETATLRLKVSQLEAELKQSSEGHAASVEAMALRSATLRAEVSSLEEQRDDEEKEGDRLQMEVERLTEQLGKNALELQLQATSAEKRHCVLESEFLLTRVESFFVWDREVRAEFY